MSAQHWFVYMILTSDLQLYTGITTDMARRWREHTSGKAGARYFNGRAPQALCLLEPGHTRASASQREYALKSLKRTQKIDYIKLHLATTRAAHSHFAYTQVPLIEGQAAPLTQNE